MHEHLRKKSSRLLRRSCHVELKSQQELQTANQGVKLMRHLQGNLLCVVWQASFLGSHEAGRIGRYLQVFLYFCHS